MNPKMKPMTKRLTQMAALYAAKQLWDRVDSDALQSLAGDLYRSTPEQWQQNASQFAKNSTKELQGSALERFDDVILRAGLVRLANVPSRSGPMLLALAGGALLGAAGTVVFLRSDAGKEFMEKLNAKVDDLRTSRDDSETTIDADAATETSESTKDSDSSRAASSKNNSQKSKARPHTQ